MTVDELPDGAVFVRVTPDFDERTVPAGLRSAHRVADGVWGRLVVRSGTLDVVFEDAAHVRHAVAAGGAKVFVKDVDIADKSKKANRGDLHRNVFDYVVRKWKRVMCPMCQPEEVMGPDTHKITPEK